MAVYNEIGIGRWNRFIQKITDIKGGPPARQLASEIVFSHAIFSGVENRYLESWNRFEIPVNSGPSAAQANTIQLRNPGGSNVIAVVEELLLTSVAPGELFNLSIIRAPQVALANVFAAVAMDPRQAPGSIAGGSTLEISQNTGIAGFATGAYSWTVGPANQSLLTINDEHQEWPILPGDTFRINSTTANNAVRIALKWRERLLEPAERF
jgi:hypothetical protein